MSERPLAGDSLREEPPACGSLCEKAVVDNAVERPQVETAKILENTAVGPNLYLMKLEAPSIAEAVRPGQFVHLKLPNAESHLLRRPFSVYDSDAHVGADVSVRADNDAAVQTDNDSDAAGHEDAGVRTTTVAHTSTIEILYQSVGAGTRHMTTLEVACPVDLIGPVGSSWKPPAHTRRVLLVGGGVGAAPLYLLAKQLRAVGVEVEVVLGAQTKSALVTYGRYLALLQDAVSVATDDGSFGHPGFCTELVEEILGRRSFDYLACCGPEALMKPVVAMAAKHGVPSQVSLERRMACGIGACLSCMVETTVGRKRACVDGPVFDASEVIWS